MDVVNAFLKPLALQTKSNKKDIFVNEMEDGIEICSKVYTTKGEIRITNNNQDSSSVEVLKQNIQSIAKDKKGMRHFGKNEK